ncbi:MAG TPA: metal-dependent transcriptional regulator [Lachnospiraceae bacterium]|nr:metal-dependent transcriptional regulator [Lachnospiraceae bacterium]
MKQLTRSQEHYLKAVLKCSLGSESARICEVAEDLHVKKSSVCTAMKKLEHMGLIERNEHQIFLTEKGWEHVNLGIDRLEIIKTFLVSVLDVEEKAAQLDACAMEHVISNKTLCSMCRQISKAGASHICPNDCRVKISRRNDG